MTAPTPLGFLDFFILEAGEYIDQLDALVLASASRAPDSEVLLRNARALRGSATMAKLATFSELAAGIERIGRSLRDGRLAWDHALSGAMISAIDECKVSLRNVRSWCDADDVRARTRITELAQFGLGHTPSHTPLAGTPAQESYLATEASNIGAGMELLVTRPADRDAATNVLRRVRALRGIASVKDHPILADVLEAAEQAVQPLENTGAIVTQPRIALLRSAATLLRNLSSSMRSGTPVPASTIEATDFTNALDALLESESHADRVVPISELFFDDDKDHVIETAPNPPATPAGRFQLETISQAEHLSRLVDEARASNDGSSRERVSRNLRRALRGLQITADSYGEHEVSEFVTSNTNSALKLDGQALQALHLLASILSQPTVSTALGERIKALSARAMMTPIASGPAVTSSSQTPPVRSPAPPAFGAAVSSTAVGNSRLNGLLETSITRLGALSITPLSAAVEMEEQPPVPIGVLLYRGRSAIERCREIRDEARREGHDPDADALSELYDLFDLALTE